MKVRIKRDPSDGYYYVHLHTGKRYKPHSRHLEFLQAAEKAEELLYGTSKLLQPLKGEGLPSLPEVL